MPKGKRPLAHEELPDAVRQWLQRPAGITNKQWPTGDQIEQAVEHLVKLAAQAPHVVFAGVRLPPPYRNHLVTGNPALAKALSRAEEALGVALRDAGEDDHAGRELADLRHRLRLAMGVGSAPSASAGPGRKAASWKRWPGLRPAAAEVQSVLAGVMDDRHLGGGTDENGVVCRFMTAFVNFFWRDAGATPSVMAKALGGRDEIRSDEIAQK